MFALSDKKLILHKDSGEGKEEGGRDKYYGAVICMDSINAKSNLTSRLLKS